MPPALVTAEDNQQTKIHLIDGLLRPLRGLPSFRPLCGASLFDGVCGTTTSLREANCPECLKRARIECAEYMQAAIAAADKDKNSTRIRDFPIVNGPEILDNMLGIRFNPPNAYSVEAPPVLLLFHPLLGMYAESPFGPHPHIYPNTHFSNRFTKISRGKNELLCFRLSSTIDPVKNACISRDYVEYLQNALNSARFDEVLALLAIVLSGDHYRISRAFKSSLALMRGQTGRCPKLKDPPEFDLLDVDGILIREGGH